MERENLMRHSFRYLFLVTIAIVTAALVSLTQGCAGQPLPKEFLTKASHFLSTAQDVQQRALKAYNAVCGGRDDNVDCVWIRQRIEDAFGITLDALFVDYTVMNDKAKEVLQ